MTDSAPHSALTAAQPVPDHAGSLAACPCCGLVHRIPSLPPRSRAACRRCNTSLQKRSIIARSRQRTAALATAGLILYPFAVSLPMLEVERFGHVNAASILAGVRALLAHGEWVVGLVVLLCSVVLPLVKLVALLVLSSGRFLRAGHRAVTYRIVEWTGRWGMLDVLLVAILVAVLKLGDLVVVEPGPAALAFVFVVVLSLLAAASFDPHVLWESDA